VLDAPCGTGRYFLARRERGHCRSVVRHAGQGPGQEPAVSLEQRSLQDLSDAAVTIDGMENVPPEDWPTVFANQRDAVRPGGVLYLTVEELTDRSVDQAFEALSARGLPAVRGEVVEGDVAGYHYYPGRERVLSWLADGRSDVIDEDFSAQMTGATDTSSCEATVTARDARSPRTLG